MARPTITFNTLLNQQGALRGAKDLRAKLANQPVEIKINTKSLAQPLGRITGDVAEFTKSLQAATARVTAFGATSGAIYLVSRGFSELAKSIVNVDKQLIELNTFLNQSQSELSNVGDRIFKIAKDTSTSFDTVAEAAKEFARQGLSVSETLERTESALILTRISGLGAAESVNALTTAINSFNKSGLSSVDIVNKLVKVDSNFAVSSNDLAQALTRVGSAAQDSGIGFEQLIAAVTAAQQTTGRGGAVIGNAFKTIFTRLKRPEVLNELESIGVAIKDQNGFLLDGISILTNYAQATKNLSQIEKARTDELLGGVFQINQLKALTSDLAKANGVYARSVEAANNANDDAIKKNKELNQSLTALLTTTVSNFQQKGGRAFEPLLRPTIKTGTNIANKFLDFIDVNKEDPEGKGKQVGESFGQSLLKGIGQAIAGPGLVVTLGIGINIARRLTSFLTDAASVLVNINNRSANIQTIEAAINNTLAQQPKLLQGILTGQTSREQAANALLEIFRQQNQQLVLQKTLASQLSRSFASSGFVANPEYGIYNPGTKRKSSGYMPDVLAQEKKEAVSRGASNAVVPYFAKAVIEGKEQTVAVNSGETLIPRFAGGRDTAIIPNYMPLDRVSMTASKGYIPNFAQGKSTLYLNSYGGIRRLLENRNPKQKFSSITYVTEQGLEETVPVPQNEVFQFGPSVKQEEYKGKNPPKGYSSWKEHRLAKNLVSVRNPATGQRKTIRLDRIVSVNSLGMAFKQSPSLMQTSLAVREMTAGDMKNAGLAFKIPGLLSDNPTKEEVNSVLEAFKKTKRKSRGYIPNFAAMPRMAAPRPVPRVAQSQQSLVTPQSPGDRFGLSSVIASTVQQALIFAIPNILAGSVANEKNQNLISGSLLGAAGAAGLAGVVSGYKQGGKAGLASGLLGAGITGSVAVSQVKGLREDIRNRAFEQSRSKALDSFNKLTENVNQLSDSISNLETLYSDPSVKPDALLRIARKQEDLLNKISQTNPELAAKVRAAATPDTKREAIQAAVDEANRQVNIKKTTLDFAQLPDAQRTKEVVTSFFSDLSIQIRDRIDAKNLTGTKQNLIDNLIKSGAASTTPLFDANNELSKLFVQYLQAIQKSQEEQAKAQVQLNRIRAPISQTQLANEKAESILKADTEARLGFLDQFKNFGKNFGDRSSISIEREIDTYVKSRNRSTVFTRTFGAEAGKLSEGGAASQSVRKLLDQPLGENLKKQLQFISARTTNQQDVTILQGILTEMQRATNDLQVISDSAQIQEDYARRILSFQEKLAFGGGFKTSIDATSKIEGMKATQRGALQFQLGSMFGSGETQAAGLINFVSNIKEKYPGLLEGKSGQAGVDRAVNIGTQLRMSDMIQSIQRDAITAQTIGQFDLARQMQSKISTPQGLSELFRASRLQTQAQLGMVPEKELEALIKQGKRTDIFTTTAKTTADERLKSAEKEVRPKAEALMAETQKNVDSIMKPVIDGIKAISSNGLKVENANITAKAINFSADFFKEVFSKTNKTDVGSKPAFMTNEANGKGATAAQMDIARSLAVTREQNALSARGIVGIPNFASNRPVATISRAFSPKLVSNSNPSGEAIINSIDEPTGKIPGMKTFSKGFIPNFADETKIAEGFLSVFASEFQAAAKEKKGQPKIGPGTFATVIKNAINQGYITPQEIGERSIVDIVQKAVQNNSEVRAIIKAASGKYSMAEGYSSWGAMSADAQKELIALFDDPKASNFRSSEQNKETKKSIAAKESKSSEAPKLTQKPKAPEAPKAPKVQEPPKTPKAPETPKVQEVPKVLKTPKVQEAPKAPEAPKPAPSPKEAKAPKPRKIRKISEISKPPIAPQIEEAPKLLEKSNMEKLMAIKAKFAPQREAEKAAERAKALIKPKYFVEGQGLLQLTGITEIGKTKVTSLKNIVEGELQNKRQAQLNEQELQQFKAGLEEERIKAGKFKREIPGQMPLFLQKRDPKSGKGTGQYTSSPEVKYKTQQDILNKIAADEAAKIQQYKSKNAFIKRASDLVASLKASPLTPEQINANRSKIFAATPEEMSLETARRELEAQRSRLSNKIFGPTLEEKLKEITKPAQTQPPQEVDQQALRSKRQSELLTAAEAKSQKRQIEKEARRRNRLPIQFINKVPGLDPQGVSQSFKKAGPGFIFTGSFQGPKDLSISTWQGFKTAQTLFKSNPELAKAILGDQYESILKNRRTFGAWNASQGEPVLGVRSDGSSLVAKLTRDQQLQASRSLSGTEASDTKTRAAKRQAARDVKAAEVKFNSNPENQRVSALIKDTIISQSKLSPDAIKAMTGVSAGELGSALPSSLNKIMTDRNIQVKQEANGLLIDLSKSKISPAESAIIAQSAAASGTKATYQMPEATKFSMGQPLAQGAERTDGLFAKKRSGLEKVLNSFGEYRKNNTINFGALAKGGVSNLIGFRNEKQFKALGADLLRYEEQLSKQPLPDEVKQQMKEKFLREKAGPFSQEASLAANEIANAKNNARLKNFVSDKINATGIDLTNSKYQTGFYKGLLIEKITNEFAALVKEGRISAQDAAKAVTQVAARKGIVPSDYAELPKAYKNLAGIGGIEGTLSSKAAQQEKGPSLRDLAIEAKTRRSAQTFNSLMNKAYDLGTKEIHAISFDQPVLDPKTGKPVIDPATGQIKTKKAYLSFDAYEKDFIKKLSKATDMTPQEKQKAIDDLRKALTKKEILQKKDFAQNRGLSYDPLKDQIITKQQRQELKEKLRENAPIKQETTPEQPTQSKFKRGFGFGTQAVGLGMSLFGLGSAAKNIYDILNQGDLNSEDKLNLALNTAQIGGLSVATAGNYASIASQLGRTVSPRVAGLTKFAGAGMGLSASAGALQQALADFKEGKTAAGLFAATESATYLGSGLSSLFGQKLVEQRLFGLGAFLGLASEIARAENFSLASVSEKDKNRSFGGKLLSGAFQTLTGQSFDENFSATRLLGDSLGIGFTAMMGPVGLAAVTAKLGYRAGNILEEQMGLGNRIGSLIAGQGFFGEKAAQENTNLDALLSKQDKAFLNQDGSFNKDKWKSYLEEEQRKLGSKKFSNGFIPNFALSPEIGRSSFGFSREMGLMAAEEAAVRSSGDYTGSDRNARAISTTAPGMPSGLPKGVMNSAESIYDAKDVWAAMFGPMGYMMKPADSRYTKAILNPAQVDSLGLSNAGSVPNFSNEQFVAMLSEAMKNGMVSAFANGFVPSPSNSNSINIYDNRNVQNSIEGDVSVFKDVVSVLAKAFPDQVGRALGPKIAQMMS